MLLSSLFGCAAPQPRSLEIIPFPGGGPAVQSLSGYTLETPIEVIAADPRGAAVLNKDIPGLLTNPNYAMFKGMSLKILAALSNGKLSEQTLAQTKVDLSTLPK
jgi:hypothetical protein